MSSTNTATVAYPGDDVIPSANMIYDQFITIPNSTPTEVFPWLVQLGAGRAGWYLPFVAEDWLVPKGSRASRVVRPEWTALRAGSRVYDYKIPVVDAEKPWFDVVSVSSLGEESWDLQGEKALVYRSERYGCVFSWTLMARREEPWAKKTGSTNAPGTKVHLRFRGKIASTGWKGKLIVWGGGLMDHLSTAPMLLGLRDRVVAAKAGRQD